MMNGHDTRHSDESNAKKCIKFQGVQVKILIFIYYGGKGGTWRQVNISLKVIFGGLFNPHMKHINITLFETS